MTIDGIKCRVWYKSQPLVCDICSNNHKAADCPLRGKCRPCHQAGHFVRDYPEPVWFIPGSNDAPSSTPLVAPPSGGSLASEPVVFDPPVGRNDVMGASALSEASQSVLDNVALTPRRRWGTFMSPLRPPRRHLWGTGTWMLILLICEIMNWMSWSVSQWCCLGSPFLTGVLSLCQEGAPVSASPALVSPEETSGLVKGLKAVLPVSSESVSGAGSQQSSGDSS